MTCIYHRNIMYGVSFALKTLHALPSTPGNHWHFYRLHSFAFSRCRVVGIIQRIAFSDGLLLLGQMRLSFLQVFHGSVAHFFLALNDIPLSERNTDSFTC